MLYYISVQVVEENRDGSRTSWGLPTFVLDSDVQGIVDREHAERIAKDMLGGIAREGITLHLSTSE